MSKRTLVFVNTRTDAGPPDPSTDIVILDTSWTPAIGERRDLIPVRPAVQAVLGRVNLFDAALERLDEWGEVAGMADRLMVGGVTWWFHARSFVRLDLHEMLLWCHVLGELAPPGRYDRILIPASRTHLLDAARATRSEPRPKVKAIGPAVPGRAFRPTPADQSLTRRGLLGAVRRPAGRVLRRVGIRPDTGRRMAFLEERLETLAAEPSSVLAVVRAASFHVVGAAEEIRRTDPYVTPVLDELAAQDHPVVSIGLALNVRHAADWDLIQRDERLLPMSFVARRHPLPDRGAEIAADSAARLAGVPAIPLQVDGYDLGPAVRAIMADLGLWFERQRIGMYWAERIMVELHSSALFTGWEGARTLWLGAARRLHIPSIAVQHGVIYPNNPDYYRPLIPGLVRPDVTCVYGSYERDLLIDGGRYDPGTVIVTGSSRIDPDGAITPSASDERETVRSALGVVEGDRLLVLSAARNPVGDEMHGISMAARMLDGPLPGVHVVIKLHPEEESGKAYESLVAGLALAGNYKPPRLTVVRDVDLYRLLRAADAHLGLYSTVLTDAVLTGTPNMIAVGQAYADLLGYVAAGVAVPVRSVDDVREFMVDPRPPTADDRTRFLDRHYRRGDPTSAIAAVITAQSEPTVIASPTASPIPSQVGGDT